MQSKEERIRQATYGSAVVWAKAGMATSIIIAKISATVSTNKTRFTTSYLLAFCGSRLRRWLRPPLRHPSGGGVLSLYPSSLEQEAYAEARLPRNAVAWLKALFDTKIVRLDGARSTRPFLFLALIHPSA
jgi:hypothetical protein